MAISLGGSTAAQSLKMESRNAGRNDKGVGTGNNTYSLRVPSAPINLGGKAVAINLRADHSCALLENGQLKCWGWNNKGQLGYGHTDNIYTPIQSY